MLIGIIVGISLTSKNNFLKFLMQVYVTIIRGTPMLVQIAATFYLLKLTGSSITALWSAIISISLNSGAYMSQIIISGINSVPKGQQEAAYTLGFTPWQTMQYITLPQAIRTVIPAIGNELVTLVKDSSLASTIGVYELTKQGEIISSQTFDIPTVYITLGIMYLLLTSIVTIAVNHIDKKMNHHA
jgi:polar amino acid transport system permease protein